MSASGSTSKESTANKSEMVKSTGVVNSACHQVSGTVELLEAILCHVPCRQLFFIRHVSRQFQDVIHGSVNLRRALFLEPMGKDALYLSDRCPLLQWILYTTNDFLAKIQCSRITQLREGMLNPWLMRAMTPIFGLRRRYSTTLNRLREYEGMPPRVVTHTNGNPDPKQVPIKSPDRLWPRAFDLLLCQPALEEVNVQIHIRRQSTKFTDYCRRMDKSHMCVHLDDQANREDLRAAARIKAEEKGWAVAVFHCDLSGKHCVAETILFEPTGLRASNLFRCCYELGDICGAAWDQEVVIEIVAAPGAVLG